MATFDEIVLQVMETKGHVEAIDLKLDEVRDLIGSLSGGGVVSQEQLDSLGALLGELKNHTEAVKGEASDLVPPTE